MEPSQSVSHGLYYEDLSPSQSSPSVLSSGRIAAIAIGTVLAVGMVCLLLFCPQILFTYLKKYRAGSRSLGNKDVPLEDVPSQRPTPAKGNDGSRNGADNAENRRRRSEVVLGTTRSNSSQVRTRGRSESRVTINNNININLNDLLHPDPAVDSRHNRDAASPALKAPQNAQRTPRLRNVQQFGDPPNGGITLQARRRDVYPASVPKVSTAERSEASRFWNVEKWAQGVPPRQASSSPFQRRPGSMLSSRERRPTRRVEVRDRSFDIPGAFPEDDDTVESFELVTAPARVHAPGAPVHGDNGFWIRDERGRYDRDGRRERDRLAREERRERREGEERRERPEREDRRKRHDEGR